MAFFKRYLLGIGIGVILVVIIMMLSTEKEQKDDTPKEVSQVEIERANQYTAQLVSLKDSKGHEIIQEKQETKDPQKRYNIKKDERIESTFQLSLKEENNKYPLAKELDLGTYNVRINSDIRHLFLDWMQEASYDEEAGLLTSWTTYQYSQHMIGGDGFFQLELVSSKDDIQNEEAYYTYFYVENDSIYSEESMLSDSDELKTEETTTPSPSIQREEPEELIITEGNVEDWDYILDDWEIEEAKWGDEYYE